MHGHAVIQRSSVAFLAGMGINLYLLDDGMRKHRKIISWRRRFWSCGYGRDPTKQRSIHVYRDSTI